MINPDYEEWIDDWFEYYEWYEGRAIREMHVRVLRQNSPFREFVMCHKIAGNELIVPVGKGKYRKMTNEEINDILNPNNEEGGNQNDQNIIT